MTVTIAQINEIVSTTAQSANGEGLAGQTFPRSDLAAQGFNDSLIEDYDAKTRQLDNIARSVNLLAQAVRAMMQQQNP